MDEKLKGSWLIHHTNKLQSVTNQSGYEKTFLAGKAGILLSAISSDDDLVITKERLEILAQAANINLVFELPKLLETLENRQLIDIAKSGIGVLAVTNASTLQHTSRIFDSLDPHSTEYASIQLAERTSSAPLDSVEISAELADVYKIPSARADQVVAEAIAIGFVDSEQLGKQEKLLFNGNLFRRGNTKKVKAVMDSLSQQDSAKLIAFTEHLKKNPCLSVEFAKRELGEQLYSKITAVGLLDVNVVSNSTEEAGFITLPSAFSKFSDPLIDDAFDLAKAFLSSLTYGITKSDYARGQITMIERLLQSLVRGEWVGPVRAIGEDYKILEFKGVVSVAFGSKKGRTGPMMKLLKREVGELALEVLRHGDISEHSLTSLPTASVSNFRGPESNRERIRRNQISISPKATNDMISALRTGNIF